MGLGKLSNPNRGHKLLLTNYPRISTPQTPVLQGVGLGPGIGTQVGTLNRALIILHGNPQMRLRPPCNPTQLHSLIRAPHARLHTVVDGRDRIWSKIMEIV